MSKLFSYRSDIDGLRAVAVLLVIFYHAKINIISGGFIGVDVFFVLSGFLITIIISKESDQKSFSYASFYLRRIRRLLPALIAMLLSVTAVAIWLLFPKDLEVFSRSLIHSYLAANNFFMWDKLGNYFSQRMEMMPLMHTWSLAVEEQFYFIWPAIFIFMHKRLNSNAFFKINILLLVSLFSLSLYLTHIDTHSAYFLLPARAFELMMGAMLAIAFPRLPVVSKNINHVLSIIGIFLIIIPALLLTKYSLFPGLNAFWPCLGAVLLIVSGKDASHMGIINKCLSIKPMVFIGLLSYSLYLWHWPIFSFIIYLGLELEGQIRLASFIGLFVLSYISWKFVEQPVQKAYIPSLKQGLKRIVLPSFIIITVIYLTIDGMDGFPQRFNNIPELDKNRNHSGYVRSACIQRFTVGNVDECWLGVKKNKLDGLLIGDSLATHSVAFLDVLAKDAGLYIHDSAAVGNPLSANPLNRHYSPEYVEKRLNYAMQFKNIYLAADWDSYSGLDNPNYKAILSSLKKLVDAGINIYVISSVQPITEEHLHRLRMSKARDFVFFDEADKKLVRKARDNTHLVKEMLRRYPQITEIKMTDVVCNNSACDTQLDGTVIYQDSRHLNITGSRIIGEKYLEKFGNPLLILPITQPN